MYKHIKFKTCDYDVSTQSDLRPVLTSLLGAKPFACNLQQASIEIDVPRDPNHEFWLRKGLNYGDGKYQDAISTRIIAFGTSEDEAKGIAMQKLTTFLDMCREQIWPSSSCLNQSEYSCVNFGIDSALQMGMDMLHVYKEFKCRISNKSKQIGAWEEITTILRNYSKRYPRLEPLITYYMVHPPPLSILVHSYCSQFPTLIKTFPRIRQKRYEEAIQSLISLSQTQISPRFSCLVRRRFEDVQSMRNI
jgi:hypothetical protein